MFRRSRLPAVAALLATAAAFAAPAPVPDPDFGGPGGIARIAFDAVGNMGDVATAAVISQGGLLLAGIAEADPLMQSDIGFARLDADAGTPDPAFGTGGSGRVLAGLAPIDDLTDVDSMPDGRLLFVASSSNAVNVIGRRNADGSADTSFNGNGRRFLGGGLFLDGATEAKLFRIEALPGGKILVIGYAGAASAPATAQVCAVAARFNADGSTDTTFGGGRGSVCVAPAMQGNRLAGAYDAVHLEDGGIVLAGVAMHPGGSGFDMAVARLLADGTLDTTFGPAHDGWAYVAFDQGGTLYDAAWAVAADASGRIVLAGQVEKQGDYDMGVARLLPDGTADPTFGGTGQVQLTFDLGGHDYEIAHSVHALPSGHVLVGGTMQVNSVVGAAVMLKPDGQLDERFGEGGRFLQADPDAPESTILNATRLLLEGDYMYMIGTIISPTLLPGGIRNQDFAAARYLIPLFSDGFDGDPER